MASNQTACVRSELPGGKVPHDKRSVIDDSHQEDDSRLLVSCGEDPALHRYKLITEDL
uniref:Uncharacterized protein n=1 Tax=Arundo donax TaxID=35708 RepID=A0A0A8Z6C7_ARUDO